MHLFHSLSKRNEAALPHKLWIRRIRKVVMVLVALAALWIFSTFGIQRLEEDNDSLHPFAPPGVTVLVLKRGIQYDIGRIVYYRLTYKNKDYLATGKIYAGPGDKIIIENQSLITGLMIVPLTSEQISLWRPMHGKILGKDEFIVINENLFSQQPDARHMGIVTRDRLKQRILLPLKF